MSDGSVLVGATVALAQVADPVTTFSQYGYPGLIILFLAVVWLDSKKQEKQARDDAKEREAREDERAKALNATLGELKTLIGRLLERTDDKGG